MFGCLADKAYAQDDTCLINDSNACNFGIAVGVIGMVMCLGFFTKDIIYIIVKQNKVKIACFVFKLNDLLFVDSRRSVVN